MKGGNAKSGAVKRMGLARSTGISIVVDRFMVYIQTSISGFRLSHDAVQTD